MADQRVINRICASQQRDKRIVDEAVKASAKSIRLLKRNPAPDTFIDRKTQEPLPEKESRYGEGTQRQGPTS
ncbi:MULTISPECIES: hypothetical protein [Bradyrhizobium]|uniref:hypothetical protein n=1 Tax=Bradyrhizobium TaxID=374 RepID=UPI0009755772|nr:MULTISPECIES: hypothetical protein [Bradyrhizobium]